MIVITGAEGYIGKELAKKLYAVEYDAHIWDIRTPLEKPLEGVRCVVHLAALVRVGESVEKPLEYYDTNVTGTLNVIRAFPDAKMIFASTGAAFTPDSPYAHSKVMCEQIIKDCCKEYTIFRFYNVGGGTPTNPEGIALAVEKAKQSKVFTIYGNDYDTKDGTCVRDYVHVEDIVDAIVEAVNAPAANTDYEPLGSGNSTTVKEYIEAHQEKHGIDFDIVIGNRRDGDSAKLEVPFMSDFMKPTKNIKDIV